MFPKITTILVNYKGSSDTIECLGSLKSQKGVNLKPLVVDNASGDGSADKIRNAQPDIEIIESPENLGFSGGNNLAIREAIHNGCDYIFLLNNDTTLEPDCLRRLLSCAEANPKAGVVGPAIYYYARPSEAWFTGSTADLAIGEMGHVFRDLRADRLTEPFEVPWTTGCAMLIRADLFKAIGSFDDRFFCYFEDVDWCYRAKRAGYQCILCPDAVLYHKVGGTTTKVNHNLDYYMTRNRLLFMKKNVSSAMWRRFQYHSLKKVLQWTKHVAVNRVKGVHYTEYVVYRTAVLDYYRGRFGKCLHTWS